MTDNALTIYQQFGQIQQAAAALYKSGYFADATSEAQAIVKVMAGAELGLPPFASMAGINIQGGKPVLGGNLIATLIKNDPRYDYKIRVMTNTECAIEFYEHGKPAGVSTFTIEDARKAKVWSKKSNGFIPLTQHNQNWESYPRNMLFNRAISNGAKWYCPGVFGGAPVYTPEEMGLETDEDGVIIEADFATSAGNTPPAPEPTGRNTQPTVPEPAAAAPTNGNGQPAKQTVAERIRPTKAMMNKLHALGVQKFGNGWDDARHELVKKLTDGRTHSSADLSYSEVVRLAEKVKEFPDFEEDKPLFEDDEDDDRDLHEDDSHPGHPSNFGDR